MEGRVVNQARKERDEGWYTDPFGRHEARWMSDGEPTKLVRDAGVDSYDAPPHEAPCQATVKIEHPEVGRADDGRRADSAQAGEPPDSRGGAERVLDGFVQSLPPF